jgi:oligoribonuclease
MGFMFQQSDKYLVWVDLEMTGLDLSKDRIIEMATVITDADLNVIVEGPVMAIKQSDELLEGMDSWNQKQHNKTGLVPRVKNSSISESEAQARTLEFLKQYVPGGKSPMCGNSICTDRRYLHKYMPELEQYFHYRNLDVSTLKELAKRWYSEDSVKPFKKDSTHTAMQDIYDSITELKYYREQMFKKK